MILVKDSFINKDECLYILNNILEEYWQKIPNDLVWDKRLISLVSINTNKELYNFLYFIFLKTKQTIQNYYSLQHEVYADTFNIVRWHEGMYQSVHSDKMEAIKNNDLYSHREFGCILYLNNNYSGGKTFYPEKNISIDPEPGKLIAHPGDKNYLHGVSKVENGTRYTIASFWSFDKNKSIL